MKSNVSLSVPCYPQNLDPQSHGQSESAVGEGNPAEASAIIAETPLMETTDAASTTQGTDRVRDPAALQLMEEMGFSRELCLVALEVCSFSFDQGRVHDIEHL